MYRTPIAPLFLTGSVLLEVNRYAQGTLVKGRYEAGEASVVVVEANVQPILRETDRFALPEGERHKQSVRIFTKQALIPVKEGSSQQQPDRFEWQGDLYEVRKVTAWKMGILDHYESVAVKVEVT